MTPEGGCSTAFRTSLKSFLDEYVKGLKRTWETFESVEGRDIIQLISGVTARQLEVLNLVV